MEAHSTSGGLTIGSPLANVKNQVPAALLLAVALPNSRSPTPGAAAGDEIYIGTISAPAASRARIVDLSRHRPLSCHLPSELAANAIVTIVQSLSLRRRKQRRADPTVQRDSNPVPSQEDRLLDLLRKAEGYAYALAHGYDIGGQTERAYGLVALGERIRDTATDVSDLARPVEPHSVGPALSLRWRAFSLRRTS